MTNEILRVCTDAITDIAGGERARRSVPLTTSLPVLLYVDQLAEPVATFSAVVALVGAMPSQMILQHFLYQHFPTLSESLRVNDWLHTLQRKRGSRNRLERPTDQPLCILSCSSKDRLSENSFGQ